MEAFDRKRKGAPNRIPTGYGTLGTVESKISHMIADLSDLVNQMEYQFTEELTALLDEEKYDIHQTVFDAFATRGDKCVGDLENFLRNLMDRFTSPTDSAADSYDIEVIFQGEDSCQSNVDYHEDPNERVVDGQEEGSYGIEVIFQGEDSYQSKVDYQEDPHESVVDGQKEDSTSSEREESYDIEALFEENESEATIKVDVIDLDVKKKLEMLKEIADMEKEIAEMEKEMAEMDKEMADMATAQPQAYGGPSKEDGHAFEGRREEEVVVDRNKKVTKDSPLHHGVAHDCTHRATRSAPLDGGSKKIHLQETIHDVYSYHLDFGTVIMERRSYFLDIDGRLYERYRRFSLFYETPVKKLLLSTFSRRCCVSTPRKVEVCHYFGRHHTRWKFVDALIYILEAIVLKKLNLC